MHMHCLKGGVFHIFFMYLDADFFKNVYLFLSGQKVSGEDKTCEKVKETVSLWQEKSVWNGWSLQEPEQSKTQMDE